MGHIDSLERLGQRADLVHLDQHRVGDALGDAIGQTDGVGHEQVVADQLNLVAQFLGQQFPTGPVVLGHAVLDRDDRVVVAEFRQIVGVFLGRQRNAFAFHLILAVDVIFGRGAIESQIDVLTRFVACFFDGLQNKVQRNAGRFQSGGKATFVADTGVVTGRGQLFFQGVEHLGAHADRVTDVGGADRHDHEFLDVDGVIGVLTTVDDVHHRNGQNAGRGAANIAEQRLSGEFGGRLGTGQRDAKDRVRAQTTLVRRAVQFNHHAVDGDLLGYVHADQGFGDFTVHGSDGLKHAFAQITALVAVALFHGFVCTGRGARGNSSAAHGAVFEDDVDLNRGVATAVQDFASDDFDDGAHKKTFGLSNKILSRA